MWSHQPKLAACWVAPFMKSVAHALQFTQPLALSLIEKHGACNCIYSLHLKKMCASFETALLLRDVISHERDIHKTSPSATTTLTSSAALMTTDSWPCYTSWNINTTHAIHTSSCLNSLPHYHPLELQSHPEILSMKFLEWQPTINPQSCSMWQGWQRLLECFGWCF